MPGNLYPHEELQQSPTIPRNLKMSADGFEDNEYAKYALFRINSYLGVISKKIDISNLDGVTVSFDYEGSLAGLDRGYKTKYKLTPTKDTALGTLGVAMAPSVIRDGKLRTHLVFDARSIWKLFEEPGEEPELFALSLHLIAHECAHVEVTAMFDKCFPGVLLQETKSNILDGMRWRTILGSWDEFAVCKITGAFGYDPTEGYLETLCKVLRTTRNNCFERIKKYRTHGDVRKVVEEVYGELGDLMSYASYFLGAALAHDDPETHPQNLIAEREFEWFDPFFKKLIVTQQALWDQYGIWTDQDDFEALGDILEEMAKDIGIKAERISNEYINFNIPLRAESMP